MEGTFKIRRVSLPRAKFGKNNINRGRQCFNLTSKDLIVICYEGQMGGDSSQIIRVMVHHSIHVRLSGLNGFLATSSRFFFFLTISNHDPSNLVEAYITLLHFHSGVGRTLSKSLYIHTYIHRNNPRHHSEEKPVTINAYSSFAIALGYLQLFEGIISAKQCLDSPGSRAFMTYYYLCFLIKRA